MMSGGDASAWWGGGAGDFTGMYLLGSDQNQAVVNLYWAYSYAITSGQSDPEAYQSDLHPGEYIQGAGGLGQDAKWRHVLINVDGAVFTCFVDGKPVSRGALPGPGGQMNGTINVTREHCIGAVADSLGHWYGSRARYAEMIFIDGQCLTWDKFAKVVDGSYVPIDNALNLGLNFGTNGFYLNWQDSSSCLPTTLGKDWSGNNNNWTPVNFDVTRVYNDFPGNPTS